MPRRHALRSLAAIVLALFATACRRSPTVEKSLLARLPRTYVPQSAVVSHDGRAVAFIVRTPEGERVVSTAGTSPPHQQCAGLVFAPKSDRLFYWTRDVAGGASTIAIVADGTSIGTDFVASGKMGFSKDGRRWFAAGAASGALPDTLGDLTLYVDGVAAARAGDLSMPSVSSDGRHVAYLTAADRRGRLVVDGVETRTFDVPVAPCAAAALASAPRLDMPLRHVVSHLADDSVLVVTRDADGWGVYRGLDRLASYPRSTMDTASGECVTTSSFAPRSLRTAERAPIAVWWERLPGVDERWRVVRNGQPIDDMICTQVWKQHPPEPTPDGERAVYPCVGKDASGVSSVVLVNGEERYGPYDDVWGIALSANGAHVAYGAARGAGSRPWAIYVDGEPRVSGLASVWRPRVSDDGAVVAWEATVSERGRGIFGVNDRRLGSFDEVLWGPELEPRERVAWIVRRGRKLTRVTVPLATPRASSRR